MKTAVFAIIQMNRGNTVFFLEYLYPFKKQTFYYKTNPMNCIRIFTTITLLAASISTFAQTKDNTAFDWNHPKYSTAKAYLYNLQNRDFRTFGILDTNKNLNKTVVDTAGVSLNKKQIKKVLAVVTGKTPGEDDYLAKCYVPHHAIVFYDENNNPVAHIAMCFYCGRKKIYPKTNLPKKGLNILKEVIEELDMPILKDPMAYERYAKELKGQ